MDFISKTSGAENSKQLCIWKANLHFSSKFGSGAKRWNNNFCLLHSFVFSCLDSASRSRT